MAKIGLFTYPALGHVNPMAALGHRLQAMGHTVVFFQLVDLEEPIRAAGLEFAAIGESEFPKGTLKRLDAELARMSGGKALKFLIARSMDTCRVMLATLPNLLREQGFDLLMIDAVEFTPVTVAEHLGIPAMTVDLLPPVFNEASAPPFVFGWSYKQGVLARLRNAIGNRLYFSLIKPIVKLLGEQRKQWGLPPIKSPNDLFSSRTRVAQMPRFLDLPRRYLPPHFHYTGPFTEEAARAAVPFPWERLNGKPLVYASMGTLQNGVAPVFQAIAKAVSGFDVQLVLSTGGGLAPEELGALPGNPIVVHRAPQIEVLKRAALVITHAGLNTALEALQYGKPMVAIPVTADQPGVAVRLERLGLALVVPVKKATVQRLRKAVRQVLGNPVYAERAVNVQRELAELQGLDQAARIVDDELKALSA